jgi:hypothetical protein
MLPSKNIKIHSGTILAQFLATAIFQPATTRFASSSCKPCLSVRRRVRYSRISVGFAVRPGTVLAGLNAAGKTARKKREAVVAAFLAGLGFSLREGVEKPWKVSSSIWRWVMKGDWGGWNVDDIFGFLDG